MSGRLRPYEATIPAIAPTLKSATQNTAITKPRQKRPSRCGGAYARALATALKTPLTKRPDSSVEKRLASATASLIATAVGVSGRHAARTSPFPAADGRSSAGVRSLQPSSSGPTTRSAWGAYSSVPSVKLLDERCAARCVGFGADDLAQRVLRLAVAHDRPSRAPAGPARAPAAATFMRRASRQSRWGRNSMS